MKSAPPSFMPEIAEIDITAIIPDYDLFIEVLGITPKGIYLVGGAIRDYLLKREPGGLKRDLDFIVFGDPRGLALRWADSIRGSFVPLKEEVGTYRVVAGGYEYDFSSPKGGDLKADANARDFTINALLADVSDAVSPILDYTGGLDDLKKGIIRMTHEGGFIDDPLRLLRAFRFQAQLAKWGFLVDESTKKKVFEERNLIEGVPGERVRDELVKIFGEEGCFPVIEQMDIIGLLSSIFPEVDSMKGVTQNRFHTLDVWGHCLSCLNEIESVILAPEESFPERGDYIREYLERPIGGGGGGGWDRASLLKFVSLFHDVGKPGARREKTPDGDEAVFYGHENSGARIFKRLSRRILMGKKGVRFATLLIKNHMRLLSLVSAEKVTRRAKARLVRDMGEDIFALFILGIADSLAGKTNERRLEENFALVGELLSMFDEIKGEKDKAVSLLDGREIMEVCGIDEGVEVGRLKGELLIAQALGEVKTVDEAIVFLKGRKKP